MLSEVVRSKLVPNQPWQICPYHAKLHFLRTLHLAIDAIRMGKSDSDYSDEADLLPAQNSLISLKIGPRRRSSTSKRLTCSFNEGQ